MGVMSHRRADYSLMKVIAGHVTGMAVTQGQELPPLACNRLILLS
jgi:hypothetical protein